MFSTQFPLVFICSISASVDRVNRLLTSSVTAFCDMTEVSLVPDDCAKFKFAFIAAFRSSVLYDPPAPLPPFFIIFFIESASSRSP